MADKEQHHHHHHHHRRHPEKADPTGREKGSQSSKVESKISPEHSKVGTSGKRIRVKSDEKPSISMKVPDFLTDRRVSQAEMQRRHTWLQRTRLSVATARNRTRVIHEVRFSEAFNGLYCARFGLKGEIIATSFGTGAIQIRNGETGALRTTLRHGNETSFPVMCCRFHPSRTNIFYASGACGNIFSCTTDTNDFVRFIEEPKNEINTIDVSPGGEYIVSGGKDAAVRLYDAELGKIIMTYKKNDGDLLPEKVTKYHRMRIFASKFHQSHPELIITGGWDDTVRIWDIRVGDGSVRSIKGPHICGEAIDVKDTQILTGSWVVRGSLQIWDMTSGKLVETIMPENRPTTLDGEFLYAVQYFDGDPYGETILAGGSGTGAVEIISLKEKRGSHCNHPENRFFIISRRFKVSGTQPDYFQDEVMGTLSVNKAVVAVDSCRTSIVFGGMESILRIADYS